MPDVKIKIWLCRDKFRSVSGILAVGTRRPLLPESKIWYTTNEDHEGSSLTLWGRQAKVLLGKMRPGTLKEVKLR